MSRSMQVEFACYSSFEKVSQVRLSFGQIVCRSKPNRSLHDLFVPSDPRHPITVILNFPTVESFEYDPKHRTILLGEHCPLAIPSNSKQTVTGVFRFGVRSARRGCRAAGRSFVKYTRKVHLLLEGQGIFGCGSGSAQSCSCK